MYISRLELKNWKNFSKVAVDMSALTIIVGPNAAGKSNLLDAIRFLRDVVRQGGGLQQAVALRGGVSSIRSQAARSDPLVRVAAEISDDHGIKRWFYELEFTQTGGGVRQTYAVVKHEKLIEYDKQGQISNSKEAKPGDTRYLEQYTLLERPDINRDFPELTKFFQGVQYLHIVPQLVRDPNSFIATNNVEDFFGRNFIKHVASVPKRTSDAYLKRISMFLQVAVPGFQEMHLEKESADGEPHLAVKFKTWRKRGVNQTEAQLSDGTLRLIGLLWALQYGKEPVLLEEPELSLHPEIVRRLYSITSLLQKNSKRNRQVILTTHSPELLSDEAIQPEEVILLESKDGFTDAKNISSSKDLTQLLKDGFNVAEVILPQAAPKEIRKLDDQLKLPLQ